jgi:hypothetical protein
MLTVAAQASTLPLTPATVHSGREGAIPTGGPLGGRRRWRATPVPAR